MHNQPVSLCSYLYDDNMELLTVYMHKGERDTYNHAPACTISWRIIMYLPTKSHHPPHTLSILYVNG